MKKKVNEVNWKPNREDPRPIYVQITDYIVHKINCGEWLVGSYLPNQRDLAALLDVNRSTVVTALDELVSMGLLEAKGKSGTQIVSAPQIQTRASQPDWQAHIDKGFHISNLDTIQIINRYEFTEGFIRLSSGEPSPEMYPKEMMAEVLGELAEEMGHLGYEEPKGMPLLREQISLYLKTIGIEAPPENILIVSGALQAIQLVSIGLLQPGAAVFLEKPSYLYSLNIFQSIGLRRCGLHMDSEGLLPQDISSHKVKHRQAMVYTVPNYHNPTGIVMSEARRELLFENCSSAKIPIVEDDVYRELWIDEPPPLPIKSKDQSGSVLYVGSMSKNISTGLRIGWLVGPEAVVDRLGDLKMQNDYGSSSLAQMVAAKFFSKGLYQKQSQLVRAALKERRDYCLEALEKHFSDLADWDKPKGGYYLWVRFRVPIRMREFFDEAFKQHILIYPGYLYDNEMNHCMRISYSYASLEEIGKAVEMLSRIARKQL